MDQFEIYLVTLDPTVGSEMRKTRPCVIVSPTEMNQVLRTVLVAPLTSKGIEYSTRILSSFGGQPGQVALDQMRCVDKVRLVKRLGTLDAATSERVINTLAAMFAP